MILPIIVTSKLMACGGGRSVESLLPPVASTTGLLALAGGGHGGAFEVEEKFPVMRGMMVVSPGATLDCGDKAATVESESCHVEREKVVAVERELSLWGERDRRLLHASSY